jgi:hemerythrin-like domain-containing protein
MTSPPTGSLHVRLLAEHYELEKLFEPLASAFRSDDWELASETYAELQARVTAHLRVEEDLLFPELVKVHPAEAEQLQHEHDAIRARVLELSIGVDLHQTTLGGIADLATMLRRHAEREDRMLYRWADRHFGEPITTFPHGHAPEPVR